MFGGRRHKDESPEDSDNLPDPSVIAAEIVEHLPAALEQFSEIEADLAGRDSDLWQADEGETLNDRSRWSWDEQL